MPYENYVTSTLGSEFDQTPTFFPMFDQWAPGPGIAVSDKTIDTQGSSYLANPNRIAIMMDKWAKMMIAFVSGNNGGLMINTTITPNQVVWFQSRRSGDNDGSTMDGDLPRPPGNAFGFYGGGKSLQHHHPQHHLS